LASQTSSQEFPARFHRVHDRHNTKSRNHADFQQSAVTCWSHEHRHPLIQPPTFDGKSIGVNYVIPMNSVSERTCRNLGIHLKLAFIHVGVNITFNIGVVAAE